MRAFLVVFISVFIAELGDKTQLATLAFSTEQEINKWGIFIASSLALTVSSFIAVFFGHQISSWIAPETIKNMSGAGFIIIGILTFLN